MQPKQRDRPGKRGGRVIKVIAIVLTFILFISPITVTTNTFTDKSSKKESNIINKEDYPNRDELIVMPDGRIVIYENKAPFSTIFRDPTDTYELVDGHLSIAPGQEYGRTHVELFNGNYENAPYLLMTDYGYVKVEFDVYNYLKTPGVECSFYLMGRGDGSWRLQGTKMHISGFEDSSKLKLTSGGGKTFEGESFHVEYLIQVDKSRPSNSRIQAFVNGELVDSSSYLHSTYVTRLAEVRFINLYAKALDTPSSIGVGNLLITGCK